MLLCSILYFYFLCEIVSIFLANSLILQIFNWTYSPSNPLNYSKVDLDSSYFFKIKKSVVRNWTDKTEKKV